MNDENINKLMLMRPFMPPLEEFQSYLERIWESRQLTNNGPVHKEFENALCKYLGVKHICLFANGTLALVFALKALNLKGSVITTPFTSVATTQAIYWNNLKPVFVDIKRSDLNIDVDKMEAAISLNTSAILPVHIFGNPCDYMGIDEIAKRHNLKVIYDAAHCFDVEINGISICNYGNLSVLSFHATKVFNCFEGGAVICHDIKTKEHIDALKNMNLNNNSGTLHYGLNAKMNEIQAAFGMIQLKHVKNVISLRKQASLKYIDLLSKINGVALISQKENVKYNYEYFPIIIKPDIFGASRNEVYEHLEKNNILAKKYFYPLVSDTPEFCFYKTTELEVAEEIANNVICLPLFHDITTKEIEKVVKTISQKQTVV